MSAPPNPPEPAAIGEPVLDLPAGSRHLASAHARRQARQVWGAIGGGIGFAAAYAVGLALEAQGWSTPLFPATVLWCFLPYLLAVHLMYRSVQFPAAEQRTLLLLNTSSPFLLLVLAFALFQQPYSRGAVLMVAVVTVLWFWAVERWKQGHEHLRLLALDKPLVLRGLQRELGEQASQVDQRIEWVSWESGFAAPEMDGAVLPAGASLDATQQQQLVQLKWSHVRLYSVEAIAESLSGRKPLAVMEDVLWQPDGHAAYDGVKRVLDVVIVTLLAPLWLPLAVAVAVAVKQDSPGPALFSQIRTGLHGRPFRIWKFRTMKASPPGDTARFAQVEDPRVTRLGKFLRKSRLDELPQLVNVLWGHMSLIGPRPEQEVFVRQFAEKIPSYPYRHLVRPGITGWAQVTQGYAASEDETVVKLSYDLYYVSHYSLALDLLIVVKTIKTMLTGFGAR